MPPLKVIAVVVFCLVLVCLGTVLVLVWTMPDLPSANVSDQICLPSQNGLINCGKTTDKLQHYLDKAIEQEYTRAKKDDERRQQEFLNKNRVRLMAVYDKTYWEMKPAAKVTGKELPEPRQEDVGVEMTPIRVWRNGRELHDSGGFRRVGVRYRNGRLVVPVSGTYFIYSFVDFFEKCESSTSARDGKHADRTIKHGIFKFNILDEEEREIVTNVQPHTISGNGYYNSFNSYVSTLAQLKAGDELSVKVSNITYLRYTRNNFFGLNLV